MSESPMEESPREDGGQRVVLLIGLPGSGKSSWLDEHKIRPLASDELRGLLLDDVENQDYPAEIHEVLRWLVDVRLRLRRPVTYVDATNLRAVFRYPFIETARLHDARVEAIWFDTPLEVCLERNAQRARRVPEEVIRAMAERFDPPTAEEGFARIERIVPGEQTGGYP